MAKNYKEYRCDSVDKIASKDSKINTDLIEYFPNTCEKSRKNFEHVDTVVNIINNFPLADSKA